MRGNPHPSYTLKASTWLCFCFTQEPFLLGKPFAVYWVSISLYHFHRFLCVICPNTYISNWAVRACQHRVWHRMTSNDWLIGWMNELMNEWLSALIFTLLSRHHDSWFTCCSLSQKRGNLRPEHLGRATWTGMPHPSRFFWGPCALEHSDSSFLFLF